MEIPCYFDVKQYSNRRIIEEKLDVCRDSAANDIEIER